MKKPGQRTRRKSLKRTQNDKIRRRRPGVGRPSLFNERISKQAEPMASCGLTEEQMADVWQVSPRTVARSKQQKPEFCHALTRGKAVANLSMSQRLYKRAVEDGDISAIKYWLVNRCPELWKSDRALARISTIN